MADHLIRQNHPPGAPARLMPRAANPDVLSLVQRTRFSHIDIIPATAGLASFDESKQSEWEKTDGHLALLDAVERLRKHYDLIVFDCPPRLSLVSFAALCASDYVIVPLEAADWGAQGIQQVTEAINYVQSRFNERLTLLGYLISRFKTSRSYQRTYWVGLRKHFGQTMFDTAIFDGAEYEKSVTDRIPITIRAPKSSAAKVAREFFNEVLTRIANQSKGPKRTRQNARAPVGVAAQ